MHLFTFIFSLFHDKCSESRIAAQRDSVQVSDTTGDAQRTKAGSQKYTAFLNVNKYCSKSKCYE